MKTWFARAALLGLALGTAQPLVAQSAPVVRVDTGSLKGERIGALSVFKGVPYAAAPTGWRRWRPPAVMSAWKGVRDATAFGPVCYQPRARAGSIYTEDYGAMSEDCLSLNVWVPANASKAPVLVWIHGGALSGGASSETMYDGATLARQGLVVVSINYRLGVLGYMAHSELSAESPRHVSGNYGLLDQIAALRWVKRNIGAFGGDAGNVTIAGESAGALSVMYLMTSPDARGLFAKAIAESAYMISTPELREKRHGEIPAEAIGGWLQTKLGAENLAGLRAMDPAQLTDQAAKAGYAPFGTIDGSVLPAQLVDVFDRGEQAHVPILAGFNSGEIRSLRFLLPPLPATPAAYETAIRAAYRDLADDWLKRYPSSDIPESMLATTRDALYGWTAERLTASQSAAGQPSFLYYFDHGYPAADQASLRGFHASEIPYVFGTGDQTPAAWPKLPDTPEDRRFSTAVTGYWAAFARGGVPAVSGEPIWRPYSTGAYMHFADRPEPATNLMPGMSQLHEQVVCRRRAEANTAWNWNTGIIAPPLPPKAPGCR